MRKLREGQSVGVRRVMGIAASFGAIAVGAFAIGAAAVGAFAIGRLSVGSAKMKSFAIDDLKVKRLQVGEATVSESLKLPSAGELPKNEFGPWMDADKHR